MRALTLVPDKRLTLGRFRIEILAGLTVGLALVPEAEAFVAGVHPLVGGRPGMIPGATGALAVVTVALVVEHGVEYLFATVVLMGLLQVTGGVLPWGTIIRLVPHRVMLDFVSGLSIGDFLAQLGRFKGPGTAEASRHGKGGGEWLSGLAMYLMLGLSALTMASIWVMPRISRTVPAPSVGIVVLVAMGIGFGLDVPGMDGLASIEGGLPSFHIPSVPLTLKTLQIILPYAVILAALRADRSAADGDTCRRDHRQARRCKRGLSRAGRGPHGQRLFGGVGGCAMIGQSTINVTSGAATRIAGIAAALFLLAFILVAAPLVELLPPAARVGVMVTVVIGTFAWTSIGIGRKGPRSHALVIVLVTVISVLEDYPVAVVVCVTVWR